MLLTRTCELVNERARKASEEKVVQDVVNTVGAAAVQIAVASTIDSGIGGTVAKACVDTAAKLDPKETAGAILAPLIFVEALAIGVVAVPYLVGVGLFHIAKACFKETK